MTNKLLLLHISDFHLGRLNRHTGSNTYFAKIFDEIKNKLRDKNIKFSDINLVIFTGDFTSEASETDFSHAKSFVKEVLYRDFDKDQLIIIPGNHDLEWIREVGKIHPKRFNSFLNFKKELELTNERVFDENYLNNPHFIRTLDNFDTRILGLNSCLYNCYDIDRNNPNDFKKSVYNNNSKQNTDINYNQLLAILDEEDAYQQYNYKIALMHHPPTSINVENENLEKSFKVINELYGYGFTLILHGHSHASSSHKYDETLTIGAGPLFARKMDRDDSNQFSMVELYPDEEMPTITRVRILNIHISYDKDISHSVTIDNEWREEILGCSKETYEKFKNEYKKVLYNLEKGKGEQARKEAQILNALIEKKIDFNPQYFFKRIEINYDKHLAKLRDDKKMSINKYRDLLKFMDLSNTTLELGNKRSKHKTAFAWNPLRALMKSSGAEIISKAAVDKLMDYLEAYAKELTICALDITKHSGRKKITQNDMKIAINLI